MIKLSTLFTIATSSYIYSLVLWLHRVLVFNQSPLLKSYIDFNTGQRPLAGNCSFLKDLFSLVNNSVFGKTQEKLRKRVNVELITDANILFLYRLLH